MLAIFRNGCIKMASNADAEDKTKENSYETYPYEAKFSDHDLQHNEGESRFLATILYDGNEDTDSGSGLPLQDSNPEHTVHTSIRKLPKINPRELRKQLKNAGKEFVNAAGKLVPAKVFINKSCGCQQECSKVISATRREKLFNNYYKIPWEEKTAFIKEHIQLKHVNRRYSKSKQLKRIYSRIYKLSDETEELKVVCKQFFIDTIAVSCKRINGALLRDIVLGEIEPDRRGRQRKVKIEDEEFTYEFISRLPTHESDGLEYITNEASVSSMYKNYRKTCSQLLRSPVSIFYFRKVFNTKFKLHFRSQRK